MARKFLLRLALLLVGLSLCTAAYSGTTSSSDTTAIENPMCPPSNIISKMISGVCWDCVLPIKVAGVTSWGGDGDLDWPNGHVNASPLCNCTDNHGVPSLGYPVGFWAPSLLVEVVRLGGCSAVLDQSKLISGSTRKLGGSKGETGGNTRNFYNVHVYGYPLFVILDFLTDSACNPDNLWDMNPMAYSETLANWNDDEIALLFNPEAVLYANPAAVAMAAAEGAYISAAGLAKPRIPKDDYIHWGAGTWGVLPPYQGGVVQHSSPPRETSLEGTKFLAWMHKMGALKKTYGDDALCGAYYFPMIPKTQYKMSMLYPSAEADSSRCCHYIGESTFTWGEWRMIPGQEDAVYLVMRYTDCCLR